MMSTKRRLREYRDYCNSHGLPVLDTTFPARGHPKIVVRLPDGSTKKIIVSSSSASQTGTLNFQSFVRRLARGLTK